MKKLLFPLFMLAMIVTSCEKDPDMNKLDSDYSVYTDYDNSCLLYTSPSPRDTR